MAIEGSDDFGWVYVLANSALARNPLKIGFTRGDVAERASELASTGLPRPFTLVYKFFVRRPDAVERLLHRALDEHRESKDREFFYCDFTTVRFAIESITREHAIEICCEYMAPDLRAKLDADTARLKKETIARAVSARDKQLAAEKASNIAKIRELRDRLVALNTKARVVRRFDLVRADLKLDDIGQFQSMFLSDIKEACRRYSRWVYDLERKLAEHDVLLTNGLDIRQCPNCKDLIQLPRFQSGELGCPTCGNKFEVWT